MIVDRPETRAVERVAREPQSQNNAIGGPSRSLAVAPHPRKRRRWSRLVLLGVVLLLGYGGYRYGPQLAGQLLSGNKPAVAPVSRSVPVVAAAARRGDLAIYLDTLGTVSAFNTVTVRTRVDGELVKVAFVEGQMVHQGDLLAEIDPRPFQVQLAQAEGQLIKDQALLTNARLDLARYATIKPGAVSQQQRDTAVATEAQYQGAVKVDQAQVDAAKLQLTYCRITAPLSGRIGLRNVDQGNMVHAGDSNGLAVITQLQPIAVLFSLQEDTLPQIVRAKGPQSQNHAIGDPGTGGQLLTAEIYDLDLKTRLAVGTLQANDNEIDPGTLTVRFKAVCENRNNELFPNQAVNVRLLVDTKRNAVLVPTPAVQQSPKKTMFVYVVTADEKVDMRPVTVGPQEAGLTLIEHGLAPGEIVVTDGVDKLQPGTKVNVRRSDVPRTRPASAPASAPEAPRASQRSAASQE